MKTIYSRGSLISLTILSVATLQGCANLELESCSVTGKASGGGSGASGSVEGECRWVKKDEKEQASLWDRFTNVLMAYTPSTLAEVDFSQFNISIGISGGSLVTTNPDVKIALLNTDRVVIAERTFIGDLNNGVLTFSDPDAVKFWAQNYENQIVSFKVNSEALNISQTYNTVTINYSMNQGSNSLASDTVSYSRSGNCTGCGEWEIE